jgi:broad specificity phosphatase PhoE
MGTLYLVRHGQASFGADDYDQLSPLGLQQSQHLGAYFASLGLTFNAVLTGTLRRHQQTLDGIAEGFAQPLQQPLPQALALPGLNEYDSHAVIATIHPHPLAKPDSPEVYKQHFRLLRDGLTQWMNGVVSPHGMPTYEVFRQGVADALEHVRKETEGNVLLVSSGGPIATAVGQVLGCTPETTIELNLQIRNTAVTEFLVSPKRLQLQSFNSLPHLPLPAQKALHTYA